MYYLYILKSKIKEIFYTGVTKDIKSRLDKHNCGGNKSTKAFKPWDIIHAEAYESKTQALRRELYLKSPKGYLEKLQIIKPYKN